MKVTAVLAVLTFTAAQAAAVADKREAAPAAVADPRRTYMTSCGWLGLTCFKKRDDGTSSLVNDESGDLSKRDANADPRWPRKYMTSCGWIGLTCFKKRDAQPDPNWKRAAACGVPGNSCHKAKRAALAVAEALADPRRRTYMTSCGWLGLTCFKARRGLEDVGKTTEQTIDKVLELDQDESAFTKRVQLINTDFPGAVNSTEFQPYARQIATCSAPGVDCAKSKRGIELLNEDFPLLHKDECFSEGRECHTIAKAHAAFHAEIKRSDDAAARYEKHDASDPQSKFKFTSCGLSSNSCSPNAAAAEQQKLAGDADYVKAEQDCYGPDGECTQAEAYLAQLEAALDKANEDAHTSL